MKKYIGLITAMLPIMVSAQIVMTGSYYVVMTGGTSGNPTSLVLTTPTNNGITNNGSGWIVSENEFNQVDWPISNNTGTYQVPFGYSNTDYLPLTCVINVAGSSGGVMKFATYHGSTWNNSLYEPSDVTNMNAYGWGDYSISTADRFWILDANSYGTKPGLSNTTFTYVRSGAASDVATPNYITEPLLLAQRFNTSLSQWYDWLGTGGTDVTSGNTGTVQSGPVISANFYRSWILSTDTAVFTSVPTVNVKSAITVYPNPGNGNFTVAGLTSGQVVEMYNYLGQLLTSAVADNSSTMHFNISTYANGIYLMRIQNQDGSGVIEKKIVKEQ